MDLAEAIATFKVLSEWSGQKYLDAHDAGTLRDGHWGEYSSYDVAAMQCLINYVVSKEPEVEAKADELCRESYESHQRFLEAHRRNFGETEA